MSLKDPNVVSKSHPKRVAIVIANPAVSTTTQSWISARLPNAASQNEWSFEWTSEIQSFFTEATL